jgi:hypothetical protein
MQKQGLERKLKKVLKFFENVPIRDLTAGNDQSLNSGRKETTNELSMLWRHS